MRSLFNLDPATWTPDRLHDSERSYTETGCWTDVMIELVAAAGDDPVAMLGGTVEVDFEFDQWTFFKPDPHALRTLYGLDVHEVQPYRSLPQMIADRLDAGQTLIPELDAFYLPDTAATSYRAHHVKTSVIPEAIDLPGMRMRYFHNAGYYELEGDDFRGVFAPAALPPYVEVVRVGAWTPAADLRAAAKELFVAHLSRRPVDNPFARFAQQLERDLPALLEADLEEYHHYAFATVRMVGAAFELLSTHLRWLWAEAAEKPALRLDEIVAGSKSLSFRLARRRPFDVESVITPMAENWQAAMDELDVLVANRER